MEKMIDLKDLLKHEVLDLYSAEEQIIKAMPAMIEKAKDSTLKKALEEHLRITEKQKTRLDKIKQKLGEGEKSDDNGSGEGKGFFSSLFGGGSQKCKGMEGLITEGEKVMGEKMTPEVLDAAIIASAQKIEHYEICGYGTARAFARELNMGEVAELLEETLKEEYEADDRLTDLAVGRLNEEAEDAKEPGKNRRRTASNGQTSRGQKSAGRNRSASKASTSKTSAAKASAGKGSKKSTKSKSGNNKKSSGNRSVSKSSKTSSKKSASRGGGKTRSSGKKSSSRGR